MGRLIVLDFDGTLTDAEREGAPFRDGYLEDVAILAARPVAEIRELAARFEAEVAEHLGRYGWLYEGNIVAPASVDPYLRAMPVTRLILDEFGVFRDENERNRILEGILYKYNYAKTDIVFRDGAEATLQALRAHDTWVVSNSHTDPIRNKIAILGKKPDGSCSLDWLLDRVLGSAKKYVIDDTLEAVPRSMSLPGLERPVLLRRGPYYGVLERLRQQAGVGWEDVVVVGDIFELDLCLPFAMGAEVALAVNEFTPSYEKDFLRVSPRGHLLRKLADLPALLER